MTSLELDTWELIRPQNLRQTFRAMWSLIDGKHIAFVPHHNGLFVDMVDDCLDEEIDGGTEDLFDVREDKSLKENGGAEVDIILSQPNCGF